VAYRDDGQHDDAAVDETVVTLHELESVLHAVLLHEVTGRLLGEVTEDLNAVDCAVVHSFIYSAANYPWLVSLRRMAQSFQRKELGR
jgi:hypothetical protein